MVWGAVVISKITREKNKDLNSKQVNASKSVTRMTKRRVDI